MSDNDPSQIKLSCWGHNQMNEAVYTNEVMQAMMSTGLHLLISKGPEGCRVQIFKNSGCPLSEGNGWNFYVAFWAAKDGYDHRGDE